MLKGFLLKIQIEKETLMKHSYFLIFALLASSTPTLASHNDSLSNANEPAHKRRKLKIEENNTETTKLPGISSIIKWNNRNPNNPKIYKGHLIKKARLENKDNQAPKRKRSQLIENSNKKEFNSQNTFPKLITTSRADSSETPNRWMSTSAKSHRVDHKFSCERKERYPFPQLYQGDSEGNPTNWKDHYIHFRKKTDELKQVLIQYKEGMKNQAATTMTELAHQQEGLNNNPASRRPIHIRNCSNFTLNLNLNSHISTPSTPSQKLDNQGVKKEDEQENASSRN